MNPTLEFDRSTNPRTSEAQGVVAHSTTAAVAAMLARAEAVARELSLTAPVDRSRWLTAVADRLLLHEEELAVLADAESGLGLPRLRSEIAGAARSAKFYASVAIDGHYLRASSDQVNETTTLARCTTPIGPVAVFGASNFPFGFGVFGHDVASAIAAGCPVVVKAHPAHPRLSVRIAELARDSLRATGAPEGLYSLVVGFDAGLQLVDAPEIKTVAFTGSQAGGMALLQRAGSRGVPVFLEMGTVNPVFVTGGAVKTPRQVEEIAAGFVASFTLGAGQFCTKPGLMFAPAGCGMLDAVSGLVAQVEPTPLLTAGIAEHFTSGIIELQAASAVPRKDGADNGCHSANATPIPAGNWASARLISVTLADLRPGSRLLAECFGPVALLCEYDDAGAAAETLSGLQGSLVASVFTGDAFTGDGLTGDVGDSESQELVAQLISQVGRVTVNVWPTGVANTWSQQHGGPWPATSRSDASSVGAGALDRFVRPIAMQNAPPQLLPPALMPHNPWNIPRRIDGIFTLPVA